MYKVDKEGTYYFNIDGEYVHECYIDFILSYKEEIDNYGN